MIVFCMVGLGFHRVKHGNFFIKTEKNLVNVWTMTLCDEGNIFHLPLSYDLNPLQIIIARLCSGLLAAQTFCKFGVYLLFPRFFALSSSIQPRKDFFLGPYGTIQCLCFHNLFNLNDSGCKNGANRVQRARSLLRCCPFSHAFACKINNKFRINKENRDKTI